MPVQLKRKVMRSWCGANELFGRARGVLLMHNECGGPRSCLETAETWPTQTDDTATSREPISMSTVLLVLSSGDQEVRHTNPLGLPFFQLPTTAACLRYHKDHSTSYLRGLRSLKVGGELRRRGKKSPYTCSEPRTRSLRYSAEKLSCEHPNDPIANA